MDTGGQGPRVQGSSALPQLVNHCQAVAMSWLPPRPHPQGSWPGVPWVFSRRATRW